MSKKILILLPSPFALPYSYRDLIEKLEKDFKVYAPALPESDRFYTKKKTWNEKAYARWLKGFLDQNEISRCFLIGHSNSGATAIEASLRYPELVAGLILSGSIGMARQSYFKILTGRVIDACFEIKLTLWGFHHLLWNLIFHPQNFLFQIREACTKILIKEMKSLKVPVLIMWGRRDFTIPLKIGKQFPKIIKNSTLYVSNSGSHDWLITHAEEFSEVVRKWAFKS